MLVGTAGFLLRMGVRVGDNMALKNGVFTAVNSELVGVFALKYTPSASAVGAFWQLSHSKIEPVLASRDFNLTPGMVEASLKLRRGSLKYPDIAERLDVSEGERFFLDPPVAILARGGGASFAESLAVGKRLRRSIFANRFILRGQTVLPAWSER